MKKIFFVPLLILLNIVIYGQGNYIPLAVENNYCIGYLFLDTEPYPKPSGATLSYFKGDSIVGEKSYSKKFISFLAGSHPCPPEQRPCFVVDEPFTPLDINFNGLYRDDVINQKVFYIPPGTFEEFELFNFALEKGDTISMQLISLLPTEYIGEGIVDSISYDTINNIVKKILHFQAMSRYYPFDLYYIQVIEGIGFRCDFCEGSFTDCNIISKTKEYTKSKNLVSIFPNPASEVLNIESELNIQKTEIIDRNGRVVMSSSIRELDVSPLLAGVYFVKCYGGNNKLYYSKFVKM